MSSQELLCKFPRWLCMAPLPQGAGHNTEPASPLLCLSASQAAASMECREKNLLQRCQRDQHHPGDAHTHSKDLMLGKGLRHIACLLLAMLPANPPQKRLLNSPSRVCSAGPDTRAAAHPELSSTSKASWGPREKILCTPESREACTGARALGKPKPSDAPCT